MTKKRSILKILKTCDAIEKRRLNPFLLEIPKALKTLKEYLALCRRFEDYCLDARTLNALSKVVALQNTLLLFQSSKLYVDPKLLKEKILRLPLAGLAEAFLKSWHPVVELEQLTNESLRTALLRWGLMAPYAERRRKHWSPTLEPTSIYLKDFSSGRLAKPKEFSETMKEVLREMQKVAEGKGSVDYWKFIIGKDFSKTVKRAYVTSFLVTYGYASLVKDEDGGIRLYPNETQKSVENETPASFPISIDPELVKKVAGGALSGS
ncbi:TPA: hypothetical protein EYP26_02625 [Candidatus Bathyarchaeota archaeon]|nr:hypothetical protein [Candidatus Bathyarchaeota archaeon]